MKHTRPAIAGATAVLAASMIGAFSAPADAQARITVHQLKTSIQHAVAHEQAQQVALGTGPAGMPAS